MSTIIEQPVSQEPSRNGTLIAAAQGIGLLDLVRLVNRRRGLVLGCFAGGLLLALAYQWVATTKYTSSVQILVMKKDSKLAARGADAGGDQESRMSEDLLATHMQILQSRQIVSAALKQRGYDQLPSIVSRLAPDQDAAAFVIKRMNVTRGGVGQAKPAHVLNVSFRHTSAQETHDILDAIVQSYIAFLGEKFQNLSKEATDLITKAKVDLANDMHQAENAYQDFREHAPLLWNGDDSINIHRVRYDQLEAALSDVQLKTSEAKARLETVRAAVADQDARDAPDLERLALLDDNNIQRIGLLVTVDKGDANTAEFQASQPARLEGARAEHAALLTLMLKEKTLRTDLGPDHPQLREVGQQIAAMREFLKEKSDSLNGIEDKLKFTPRNLVHAYLGLLEHDLTTLESRERELLVRAEKEREAAKALVSYELRGETLRKEATRKQQLYDTVLDRLREVNLVKPGFVTEVIDPVGLGKKADSVLLLSIITGGFLGLVLGVGAALAAETLDPKFVNPDDVSRTLNLPILSCIPNLRGRKQLHAAARSGSPLSPELVAFHRPRGREAEMFRELRTGLFFRLNDPQQKIIMITSANSADGKTTIAANLAVSLAQVGRRVLLVDCDMRYPSVHKVFAVDSSIGLSDVVSGSAELADAIRETDIPNLSLLPSGSFCSNPADMLSSRAFAELIDLLRDRFDFVLLDTPPLLAVTDPCVVAARADGVVVAVRLTKDTRLQVMRAKDMLVASKAKLIGVAVNAEGSDYGVYGYRDDASHAYYRDDEDSANDGVSASEPRALIAQSQSSPLQS